MYVLVGSMFAGWLIYDRLDKPNFLKRMRILCKTFRLCLAFLIIFRVIQVGGLFFETHYYTQPSAFKIIFNCVFVIFFVWFYLKYCWYYLKNRDDNGIIFGWYMKKYVAMKKNKNSIKQAYEYLNKALEYNSDSVFIWSMRALFNQCFFDKPDLADEYLIKAQQILDNSELPSQKDKATLESVKGEILLHRDNIEEGLEHLKNACDLDTSSYKEKYEKAFKEYRK
ncbi:MAG: hypothetical protein ISS71_05980 [Phycisphaerae bacterium]|nr:hypothetical protein [Phycisphaerae bacterium]